MPGCDIKDMENLYMDLASIRWFGDFTMPQDCTV
jgi:hypothetical protein